MSTQEEYDLQERSKRLRTAAEIQQITEARYEKWWHRAPFIYALFLAAFGGMFALGGYAKSVSMRLDKIEELSMPYKTDNGIGIVEEVHTLRTEVDRNKKQLNRLNTRVFKLDETEP